MELIKDYKSKEYSNLELVQLFLAHIDEFEHSRLDEEKKRQILFPREINSLFEVAPIRDSFIPSVKSLEILISKLQIENKFIDIFMGIDEPYISIRNSGKKSNIYLKDTPRLRQYYYDYECYRSFSVRLDSLNFALKYIKSRGIKFEFYEYNNLREIEVKNKKMIFVNEYCLSKVFLANLCPNSNSVIVNLHNWNGALCISNEAYEFANSINVELLDMDKFYKYVNQL